MNNFITAATPTERKNTVPWERSIGELNPLLFAYLVHCKRVYDKNPLLEKFD